MLSWGVLTIVAPISYCLKAGVVSGKLTLLQLVNLRDDDLDLKIEEAFLKIFKREGCLYFVCFGVCTRYNLHSTTNQFARNYSKV